MTALDEMEGLCYGGRVVEKNVVGNNPSRYSVRCIRCDVISYRNEVCITYGVE